MFFSIKLEGRDGSENVNSIAANYRKQFISVVKRLDFEYNIFVSLTRLFSGMDFYFSLVAILLILDVVSTQSAGRKNLGLMLIIVSRVTYRQRPVDYFTLLDIVVVIVICNNKVNVIKSKEIYAYSRMYIRNSPIGIDLISMVTVEY